MQIDIKDAGDIGVVIRAARKAQKLRQDDAAGCMGVSESFLGKVESGATSVQWGKLFRVLNDLGLYVIVDVPGDISDDYARAKARRSGNEQHEAS